MLAASKSCSDSLIYSIPICVLNSFIFTSDAGTQANWKILTQCFSNMSHIEMMRSQAKTFWQLSIIIHMFFEEQL